jgi:hypothetical protein
MGFFLRTQRWGFAGLLACASLGCNEQHPSTAPYAQQSFTQGVHTNPSSTDTSAVPDAGTTTKDASTAVCIPGQQSVPYSAADPCNQITSSCALLSAPAVSTCLSDGTWNTLCSCSTMVTGTGGVGAAGTGIAGGF